MRLEAKRRAIHDHRFPAFVLVSYGGGGGFEPTEACTSHAFEVWDW